MVDDAHGIGALGETGRGTIEHFGLDGIDDGVDVITGTFSKSLASLGGFVVASEEVIHFVKHNARSLIFSASPSPSNTAAALAAVNIIDSEPWRVARLAVIAARMKASLDGMGYDTMDTETPIIPILVGSEEATFEMAKNLFNVGLFVNPVIPPGAPVGLIRTSFMAVHSDEELDLVESTFRALAPAKQAIDQSAAR